MMRTALSHAFIAVVLVLAGQFFGYTSIGVAVALSFYFGREVAQHERKTPGTDPFRGLYFWKWGLDAKLDMSFPIFAVLICLAVLSVLKVY